MSPAAAEACDDADLEPIFNARMSHTNEDPETAQPILVGSTIDLFCRDNIERIRHDKWDADPNDFKVCKEDSVRIIAICKLDTSLLARLFEARWLHYP